MKTLALVLWLLLVLVPIMVQAQTSDDAAKKDKAAAEAVFKTVDGALVYWANNDFSVEAKDALTNLRKNVSAKGVKINLQHLGANSKGVYLKKMEATHFPNLDFCAKIDKVIKTINYMLAHPDATFSTDANFGEILLNYSSSRLDDFRPNRQSIGEWAWPVENSGLKKPFNNKVVLIKENGQWRLSELQILVISDLRAD